MESIRTRVVEVWAGLLLLIYPTMMLTVRGGMNAVFILALLSSLLTWTFWRGQYSRALGGRELWIFSASMLGLFAATLASQTYWQSYSAHAYDAVSRYWLAIPILLWFSSMPAQVFSRLQYAFPLAAIAGFLLSDAQNGLGRATTTTLDPIHFGDAALLLGFMSLYSLNWFGCDRPWMKLLKLAGFIAGLAASFASGSRGGWLAIPAITLLSLYLFRSHLSWKKTLLASLILAIVGVLTISYNGMVKQRVVDLQTDIKAAQEGSSLDTSLGIRWQLYRAAMEIFMRNPLFGVGPEGFAKEMKPMQEAGLISSLAADLGRGEVHNDILAKAAGMGSLGVIAIMALYAVPLMMFWGATKSAQREVRRTGILGIVFVSTIAVFGLTVEFLNLTLVAAFYAFTVAVLLAACHSLRNNELRKEQEQYEQAP